LLRTTQRACSSSTRRKASRLRRCQRLSRARHHRGKKDSRSSGAHKIALPSGGSEGTKKQIEEISLDPRTRPCLSQAGCRLQRESSEAVACAFRLPRRSQPSVQAPSFDTGTRKRRPSNWCAWSPHLAQGPEDSPARDARRYFEVLAVGAFSARIPRASRACRSAKVGLRRRQHQAGRRHQDRDTNHRSDRPAPAVALLQAGQPMVFADLFPTDGRANVELPRRLARRSLALNDFVRHLHA